MAKSLRRIFLILLRCKSLKQKTHHDAAMASMLTNPSSLHVRHHRVVTEIRHFVQPGIIAFHRNDEHSPGILMRDGEILGRTGTTAGKMGALRRPNIKSVDGVEREQQVERQNENGRRHLPSADDPSIYKFSSLTNRSIKSNYRQTIHSTRQIM